LATFRGTQGFFLDLNARTIEDWPDSEEWATIPELLGLAILNEGEHPRAEEEHTNDALACQLALSSVRIYAVAASEQMRRIDVGLSSLLSPQTDYVALQQAYIDIHFYFVCWSRVEKMIRLVERRSGLGVSLPSDDRAELEHYRQARHHLEHYAERLPGEPRMPQPMSEALQLGSLRIDGEIRQWEYHNEPWDVSARSVQRLREIAFNFENEILRESLRVHQDS
jgi:hypothetical protein